MPVLVTVTVAERTIVYRSGFPPGGVGPEIGAGREEMLLAESGVRVRSLSEKVVYERPKPNS